MRPETAVSKVFQFTPLREGRPSPAHSKPGSTKFQFTPLREGRRINLAQKHRQEHFNSRPCVRGDELICSISKPASIFQFTPLREGRRALVTVGKQQQTDFNSRPCVRGDHPPQQRQNAQPDFNSRPCVRGDSKTVQSFVLHLYSFAAYCSCYATAGVSFGVQSVQLHCFRAKLASLFCANLSPKCVHRTSARMF